MKITDTIRRAGRSLRQAKARTLLTSLAIGVGAFTITLSLAAGDGGRRYAQDIISSNTDVRELYVQRAADGDNEIDMSGIREYTDDPTINYGGGFTMPLLTQKDIDVFERVEGVESVTPYYTVSPKFVTREGQKKYVVGAETYQSAVKLEYVAGNDAAMRKGRVIIPDALREKIGFSSPESAIGQTILIVVDSRAANPFETEEVEFEYEIIGVNKASALAIADGSANMRLHKYDAKELYDLTSKGTPNEGAYIAATVLTKDTVDVKAVKEKINAAGPYQAQTAEDAMGFLFQFINVLQGMLLGFGTLAVLTAIFGIINTQYISVLERTQQIGLMKALGMTQREVGRLFKIEAAWIGFLGGALGTGLAIVAGTIANPFISDALSLDNQHLLGFNPFAAIAVIIGLMFVSVVSGILPARKAAKLDPIEALRTE